MDTNTNELQNDTRQGWAEHFSSRRGGRTFLGLALAAAGGFWLVSNLGVVTEPARIVLPGLVILLGVISMFTRRERR